jgi:hypothetical protein
LTLPSVNPFIAFHGKGEYWSNIAFIDPASQTAIHPPPLPSNSAAIVMLPELVNSVKSVFIVCSLCRIRWKISRSDLRLGIMVVDLLVSDR